MILNINGMLRFKNAGSLDEPHKKEKAVFKEELAAATTYAARLLWAGIHHDGKINKPQKENVLKRMQTESQKYNPQQAKMFNSAIKKTVTKEYKTILNNHSNSNKTTWNTKQAGNAPIKHILANDKKSDYAIINTIKRPQVPASENMAAISSNTTKRPQTPPPIPPRMPALKLEFANPLPKQRKLSETSDKTIYTDIDLAATEKRKAEHTSDKSIYYADDEAIHADHKEVKHLLKNAPRRPDSPAPTSKTIHNNNAQPPIIPPRAPIRTFA